ncbi:MAG: TIM-barrel domain-containing protein [Candidatus Firestonebacteria bacterium]
MDCFKLKVTPVADKSSIVKFGNARFTILKDRLIRCEYSNDRNFEDRPTQHFWFRLQPKVPYSVKRMGDIVEVKTKELTLAYFETGEGFTPKNLSIRITENGSTWKFDDIDKENLFGTARTLDNCNGDYNVLRFRKLHLSPGLLSRSGWSIIDDSRSLVFNKDGFLQPRMDRNFDIYFFGYASDYKACLIDYYAVSGNVRMIPRWSLGIWWSRWEKYTQSDLERIAGEFEEHKVPLSVCVVDMDWHLPGWTGYTWNPKYFPDPKGFFKKLHAKNIHVCMNLHPSKGVGSYEKMYPAFAKYMGLDPKSKTRISFDLSNRKFIKGYFRFLHHPLEKDGVDFWWIDWQQGTESHISGLDPLWYLNHLHSADLCREGKKRPINFSRWGDNGSHRYPVGFSGDTLSTWKSLKFQLYFTATASNIGYSWWSHDIGGFAQHFHDEELYVRWVQFGCFSPIFRFHSSGDPRLDNRPWTKPDNYRDIAITALKLRNSFLPYLYTVAWKNRCGGLPLIRPMYHEHPKDENAYACPNQYYFGEQLIAAPFDERADENTLMARKAVWLPKGTWYNFFTGKKYEGGRWYALHGTLNDIPVFAVAGSVIPLKVEDGSLEIVLFNGKGFCELYDDDGETLAYKSGGYTLSFCRSEWRKKSVAFTMEKKSGKQKSRNPVNLVLRGVKGKDISKIIVNGKPCKKYRYTAENDFRIEGLIYDTEKTLKVVAVFQGEIKPIPCFTLQDLKKVIQNFNLPASPANTVLENMKKYFDSPDKLVEIAGKFTPSQLKALFELGSDVGFYNELLYDGREVVVWWNEKKLPEFEVHLSLGLKYSKNRPAGNINQPPVFIAKEEVKRGWRVHINYFNAATTEVDRYFFKR